MITIYRHYIENFAHQRDEDRGGDMHRQNPSDSPWAGCDPVRRQQGERAGGPGRGGPWGGSRGGWSGGWSGPPPWLGELIGQQWGQGAPWAQHRRPAGSRRPQVRRGDVRTAILAVLAGAGEPTNGYQVIQEIAAHSRGIWRPSPGSVYPTIAQLQDEGLVEDAPSGRKALQLTDEGRAWVADHQAEIDGLWAPFQDQEPEEEPDNLRQVIGQTVAAIVQIASTGTPDQRDRAVRILADTRRRLYGVLADGDLDEDAAEDPDGTPQDGADDLRQGEE
jgi:DNA-binding PadR family transcriptional regulator